MNDLLHLVEVIEIHEVADKTCLVVHHHDETTTQELHALRVAIHVSNVVRRDTWLESVPTLQAIQDHHGHLTMAHVSNVDKRVIKQETVQMQTSVDRVVIKENVEVSIVMATEDMVETIEAAIEGGMD